MWRLYRLWLQLNPAVFSAGSVLTASALNDATLSAITSYTPAVANGGTVTWTTRTGWYYKIGTSHLVYMNAYLVVNAAGSGSTDLTITAPSNIDRTTRQIVPCFYQDGTNLRVGCFRANTSGSTNVFDKIDLTNSGSVGASELSGAGLNAGSIIAAQGFYREA